MLSPTLPTIIRQPTLILYPVLLGYTPPLQHARTFPSLTPAPLLDIHVPPHIIFSELDILSYPYTCSLLPTLTNPFLRTIMSFQSILMSFQLSSAQSLSQRPNSRQTAAPTHTQVVDEARPTHTHRSHPHYTHSRPPLPTSSVPLMLTTACCSW